MTMANPFAKFVTILLSAIVLSSVAVVICHRVLPVPVTSLMLIRRAQARTEGRNLAIHRQWVPLDAIAPELVATVVNSEDAHFYEHNGFDLWAMEKAMHINFAYGHIVMGGSTISQQTAKNVFCTPSRTYLRKVVEAYFTVLIEFLWGKERIIEVYLNVIEWGDGIFGIEAAAQHYFKHSATQLSAEEIQYLVSLIPNPRLGSLHEL